MRMAAALALFLLSALLPVSLLPRVPAVKPEPLEARLRSVVCRIDTLTGSGSGVWVSPELVATAYHVVSDAIGPIWLQLEDGHAHEATVIKTDPEHDLALLRCLHAAVAPHRFIELAKADPNLFSRCMAVGHQLGLAAMVTDGRIQSYGPHEVMYSAPGIFGSSGGGVFIEEDGRWVLYCITQRIRVHQGSAVYHMLWGSGLTDLIELVR